MNDDKIYDVEDYEEVIGNEIHGDSEENQSDNIFTYIENNKKTIKKYKMNKKKGGFLKALSLILVGAIVGGGVGGYSSYMLLKDKVGTVLYANPQSFENTEGALSASEAFEKVAPAVVIVSVNGTTSNGFFSEEVEGIGSGFIINEDGYILTNYHVIKDASVVTVTLSDGRDVSAKVVNYDQNQDIAMLKITEEGIVVPGIVELGDSSVLKPGEQVLAIGTPLSKDFNQTLTGGYVSAVNRTVETSSGVQVNLIQTDAAINPGNSGGPLINTKGEVVGINTLKISDSEVEGIGFSIPINEVKDRIEALSKPILNLGVSIREINEELSKQYDMEEGLYVVQVTEFSPAEVAGIAAGDVIVKFDGQRITNFEELRAIRDTKSAGDVVQIELIRNGSSKTVNLQLEEKE